MIDLKIREIIPFLLNRGGARGQDRADRLLRLSREKGPQMRFSFAGQNIFIFAEGSTVQEICVTQGHRFKKSPDYQILQELTGPGLLTTDGDEWKKDRQAIRPLFNPAHLATLDEAITLAARDAVLALRTETGTSPQLTCERMAFRIVNQLCLRSDSVAALPDVNVALEYSQTYIVQRGFALWDWRKYIPNRATKIFNRNVAQMNRAVDHSRATGPSSRAGGPLAHTPPEFQGDKGLAQLVTLYLAGHETTAAAMLWLLTELARFPEVQERIRQDRDLVDAFIFEVLRLWPPVAFMGRQAIEDVTLQNGTLIPKNSILILSPYVIHRQEINFPRPDEFDLDRWTDRSPAKTPGYLPYGLGGRGCLGARLAHMELSAFMNELLDAVRVEPARPDQFETPAKKVGLTMKPTNGTFKITSLT